MDENIQKIWYIKIKKAFDAFLFYLKSGSNPLIIGLVFFV